MLPSRPPGLLSHTNRSQYSVNATTFQGTMYSSVTGEIMDEVLPCCPRPAAAASLPYSLLCSHGG